MRTKHSRRAFIGGLGAASLGAWWPASLVFGQEVTERRLLVVVLRGALDGLAAVVPFHERRLRDWREALLPPPPGEEGGALALGADGFALHPALPFLHGRYGAGELAVLHAASTPYRERSHFDAQDVLENGAMAALQVRDGWLNRALQKTPVAPEAAAVGAALPLLLRGGAHAVSWAPSDLPEPDDDTLERLMRLYEGDPALHAALADAQALDDAAGGMAGDARGVARGRDFVPTLKAGANLLASGAAGVVAVSLNGWDTHNNQGAENGALATRLGQLDDGLAAVRETLGEKWAATAVLVATEFGRTVRVNGTRGSDHGTGGAAFLLGGAVHGGRMVGEWPGLEPSALYEDRDLFPANDLRALFKGVLRDHLGVARADLDRFVFPDSTAAAPLEGLLRAETGAAG